jgi:predicted DNA-binding transcriptional regulator AlpA
MTKNGRVVIDAILENRVPAKLVSSVAEVVQGKQKYDPNEGRVKPLLYNMNEAALQMGCSRSRFWELRKEGVVPTVKVLGTIFVRREDLERIVQELDMHGINEGGDNE